MDQIKPKIERILALDLRTEEARQEHTEFVYRTLCEMAADIEMVWKAAGDYPEGVISGDVWITGADYASHAKALTLHFGENGWLKNEANASSLWVQATIAVCSHYHDLVGPAMNASADCSRRLGDIIAAIAADADRRARPSGRSISQPKTTNRTMQQSGDADTSSNGLSSPVGR